MSAVDITPEPGAELWGYGDRNKAAGTGTLDPLFAKTLFVKVGDENVAIVTLTWAVFLPNRSSIESDPKPAKRE